MPTMPTGRGASRTSRPMRAAAATCLLLLLACPHLAAGLQPFSSATDLLAAMRGAYTSIRDMLPLLAQDLIDNLGSALNTTLTDYLGSIVGQDNTTTAVASLSARKLQAFSLLALPSTRTLVAHGALYRQDCPADDLRGPVVADKGLVGGFLRDSVFAAMAYVPDRLPAPGTGIQNVTLGSARIQPPITTYLEIVGIYTVESVNSQPFYIALDHNYQRILLVIRGSAANNDWWTNIVDSTPVNISYTHPDTGARTNAWVHKGFKGNAEGVFGLARANLTKVVAQYPSYKLHVIGHSLGGAICSHITFMLAVGEFNITGLTPDRVNSTCFSVPRTYDWNTARLAARYVRTVYKGADVVVRVTPDAARAALSRAAVVRDLIPTTCQLSVTQLAQAVGLLGSGLTGSSTDCTQDPTAPGCAGIVAGLASCMNFDLAQAPICLPATNLTAVFGNLSAFLNMDPSLPDVINSTVLFCPGTLYQLAEGGMLSAASPEDFPDIVTWKNGTGLNDHFMGDSVVPALNGVYQSLGGSALVDPMPSANGTMPASPSAPGGTAPGGTAPAPSPSPHNHAGPLAGAASSLLLAMVSVVAMWLARW